MNATLEQFIAEHSRDMPPVRHQKRKGGHFIGGPTLICSDGSYIAGGCFHASPADPKAAAPWRRRYWQVLLERVEVDLRQLGAVWGPGMSWPVNASDWRLLHYGPAPADKQEAAARLEAIRGRAKAALEELDRQLQPPAGAGRSSSLDLSRPVGY